MAEILANAQANYNSGGVLFLVAVFIFHMFWGHHK